MTKYDILKKALLDSTLKEIKAIEEADYPVIETDIEYDRKIYSEIRKNKAKINRRNIRISILAAILVTLTMIMSISAIRIRVVDFVVAVYEKFICLSIDEEAYNYPKTIETVYKPSYVPNDHLEHNIVNKTTYIKTEYKNLFNTIMIYQYIISAKDIYFDNEYSDYTPVYIDDQKVYFTTKEGKYTVKWLANDYSFVLSCPEELGWDEIERIILSIEEVPMEQ